MGARDDPQETVCPHASGPATVPTRVYSPFSLILLILSLVMLSVAAPPFLAADATAPVEPTRARIDPNVAPWWELTALPRVGRVIARRIVLFREPAQPESAEQGQQGAHDCVAFKRPADLARVRGIGPVTLQRISPYLRFGDANHPTCEGEPPGALTPVGDR